MSEENKMPVSKIQQDFEAAAANISADLVLDYNDIKGAYANKPESLTQLFNGMEANRKQRNWNIGWTVLAIALFWLAAPVAGYFAYQRHEKVKAAEKSIRAEVVRFKAALPAPNQAAPA